MVRCIQPSSGPHHLNILILTLLSEMLNANIEVLFRDGFSGLRQDKYFSDYSLDCRIVRVKYNVKNQHKYTQPCGGGGYSSMIRFTLVMVTTSYRAPHGFNLSR